MAAVELQREHQLGTSGGNNALGPAEFSAQLAGKKVAGKTMERLKKLIWLAAQDVKAELGGRDVYQYNDRRRW